MRRRREQNPQDQPPLDSTWAPEATEASPPPDPSLAELEEDFQARKETVRVLGSSTETFVSVVDSEDVWVVEVTRTLIVPMATVKSSDSATLLVLAVVGGVA